MLAATAVALTSTIGMAGAAEQRFTHDGNTFVCTTHPTRDGRTVISGRRLPSGEAFRLVVDGKRVSGMSGGAPVSFRTESAKGAAAGVEAAANRAAITLPADPSLPPPRGSG